MAKEIKHWNDGSYFDTRMSPYNEVLANLASLNEIIAQLALTISHGWTPDPEMTKLIISTLRDHTWRLGFEFEGQRPTAEDIERLKL